MLLDPAVETGSGLSKVCVASCMNVTTYDQALVTRTIGYLSDAAMLQIEACSEDGAGIAVANCATTAALRERAQRSRRGPNPHSSARVITSGPNSCCGQLLRQGDASAGPTSSTSWPKRNYPRPSRGASRSSGCEV